MRKKIQVTKSLSTLAEQGIAENFEGMLKVIAIYISNLEIVQIKYTFKSNTSHTPADSDESIVRAAYERILTAYTHDLKSRKVTFASMDDLKNHLLKKIGKKISDATSILEIDQIFRHIVENDKQEDLSKSNVAKYLEDLGIDKMATKEGFAKYAAIYKEKFLDNVPNAHDDHLLNSFRMAFEKLSDTFHLIFTEDDKDYEISITIKEHLKGLNYDLNGSLYGYFEKYNNNYISTLMDKALEKQIYPIEILISCEIFNIQSKKLGEEPSDALKKEIAIHEILHALGLSHPEENDAIHYTQNKTPCTIMESSSDNRYHMHNSFFSSVGPNDIVALEAHGYRVRSEAYQGNTSFALGTESHPTHKTITTLLDRDGYNTLDTSFYSGSKEVHINLSYGCSNPSIAGDQLYFLDYDSKFNAIKTGKAPHKINDKTKHDVDFFLGEGSVKIDIYSKAGHKVIYNFNANKHEILALQNLQYQTDNQGNCVGSADNSNELSITYNSQTCEELGLEGLINDMTPEL